VLLASGQKYAQGLTVRAVKVCNTENIHGAALSCAGTAEGCLALSWNGSGDGNEAEEGDE
jgi:hypothetical protein